MAHNPRRSRDALPEPRTAILTNDQIAEAMARAVALRHRTSHASADVNALALDARDAVRTTENWRTNTRSYRISRVGNGDDDPWYLIGWVSLEVLWGFKNATGQDRYDQIWQVSLDVEDGRVGPKLECHGRFADAGAPRPWAGPTFGSGQSRVPVVAVGVFCDV